MNFPKPALEMGHSVRRELLLSISCSILLTAGIAGALALVTIQVARILEQIEPAQPIMVNHAESEDQAEEDAEEAVTFEPSPTIPPAPSSVAPVTAMEMSIPEAIPVPEIEKEVVMDDLAWSEESIEPWMEEKKPVVKKKPTPRPVVARKSTPRRKTPTLRPAPKTPAVKPVAARVVSRCAPSYPSSARRAGLEGKVVVTVAISSSGRVSSARVSKSSRHSSLDSAALRAAKKYRFTPARNSKGQAVSATVAIPFAFKLT